MRKRRLATRLLTTLKGAHASQVRGRHGLLLQLLDELLSMFFVCLREGCVSVGVAAGRWLCLERRAPPSLPYYVRIPSSLSAPVCEQDASLALLFVVLRAKFLLVIRQRRALIRTPAPPFPPQPTELAACEEDDAVLSMALQCMVFLPFLSRPSLHISLTLPVRWR